MSEHTRTPDPQRARRALRQRRRCARSGRPSTRSCSSAGCGSRCCEAQRELGIAVPDGVIEAYGDVVDQVDLASIDARERVTRHDVKARIEEFCALAGHEHIHKGMTSRDLTENVEQMQVRAGLSLVRERMLSRARAAGRSSPPSTRAR